MVMTIYGVKAEKGLKMVLRGEMEEDSAHIPAFSGAELSF